MNVFLKRLVLFLLIVSVFFICIWVVIRTTNKLVISKCNVPESTSTLILGDSHTMWALDDHQFLNVRNISLNAEGYIFTYYKLKRVLTENSNVKNVYLGFSFHNISAYYDSYIFGNKASSFFYRYVGILEAPALIDLLIKSKNNLLNITTGVIKNGSVAMLEGGCTIYGNFPEKKMLQEYEQSSMINRIKHQYYVDNKVQGVSELNVLYLNKIIGLCKANDLMLTLISTPIHKDYRASIPITYQNRLDSIISTNRVDFYEFNNLDLPDSCFLPDGDHVNYHGAQLVTEHFKDYLLMCNQ